MKKVLFVVSLMLILVQLVEGQAKSNKVDILWGDELRESRRSTLGDVVGYDETGFYALKDQAKGLYGFKSTYTLEHFNNKMNKTASVELVLKENNKNKQLEFIVQQGDYIYLFSSFRNQSVKKKNLYVQSVNKKSLQLNNDTKKIAEIEYAGKSRINSGRYSYEISQDSSKILIYYDLPYERGESEKFGFIVFDKNLYKLWDKEITVPHKEELFDIADFEVDNNGNVHLLGLIYKEKRKEKRKGEPNYKYQVLSYYNKGEQLSEYPIQVEGKFLTDMQIAVNNNQEIICGGFYSSEGTFSIEGSYFLRIDTKSQEIISKNFYDFGMDFITQNMTVKQEKKAKKKAAKGKSVEMFEYDLDDILLREDGGAVLIGEQYYVRVMTYTSTDANGNSQTSTTYYYYYNDIIVVNMSPEGEIEWTEKIPKKQVTANDGGFFSSYALSVVKDKLYFVFNDNARNLHYKGDGKVVNFVKSKDALVVLVTVDSEGKHTREALFSAREADILTRPKVCEQISGNELVLFGQRKKTQRFAKITFKE